MNILVTGADGVLGSNLVRILLRKKHQITVFIEEGKKPVTLLGLNIKRIYGNILNYRQVAEAVAQSEAVIHCAASTAVWPARSSHINKVNIEGTDHVIRACLEHNVKRMIYVGTANSFGFGNLNEPGNENKPYRSAKYGLDYMDSKRIAQEKVLKAVREQNLQAVVVNPTFMIGPFDSKPSSGAMILALINQRIPGYTRGGKNYINVKDVAVGIANAITMGKIGECYILGNENLSFKAAFEKIANVVNCKAPGIRFSGRIIKAYGWLNGTLAKIFRFNPSITYPLAAISCEEHYYSSSKAVRELQLPQTPLEKGIRDCYEWFIQNGYIKK